MTESTPPIRSDEFWFEDGDTILIVREDDVEIHFRIHRAILTISSPVFRDMFTMPQPPELHGEAVRVPLHGDSLHDVKALLGALYVARMVPELTFDKILGVMRLSHKYQMEGLQQSMMGALEKIWIVRLYVKPFKLSSKFIAQAARLIEVARQATHSNLLRAAFFVLACAWGTEWEDIIKVLSPDDVARLTVGIARSNRQVLAQMPRRPCESETNLGGILYSRSKFPPCTYVIDSRVRPSCDIMISQFRSDFVLLLHNGVFAIPALQQFQRTDLGPACKSCKDWLMYFLDTKRKDLWDSILVNFKLEKGLG